jgi:tetratricopeptide (TPR) repeat protein
MTDRQPSSTKTFIILGAGILLGFVVGFALANSINRREQDKLQAELTRLHSAAPQKAADAGGKQQAPSDAGDDSFPTLTDEQLKGAVAKADASPNDVELQKKAGQALYVYAWQKGNSAILPDVARILKRAHDLDPKDFKTSLMAGDAFFLVARNGGDTRPLADARKLYEAALAAQPEDAEARTKLGMTYFYDKPSDPRRAIQEYRRAVQSDPKQEAPLQSLAAALIETGELEEAGKRLEELAKLNPSNKELPNLRAQLEQKRNAAKEKQ